MGHTQGPWNTWQLAYDSDEQERLIVVAENGETEVTGIIENENDARLIAAAPDMLAACKTLLRAWDAGEETHDVEWEDLVLAVGEAREAIAKATGQ